MNRSFWELFRVLLRFIKALLFWIFVHLVWCFLIKDTTGIASASLVRILTNCTNYKSLRNNVRGHYSVYFKNSWLYFGSDFILVNLLKKVCDFISVLKWKIEKMFGIYFDKDFLSTSKKWFYFDPGLFSSEKNFWSILPSRQVGFPESVLKEVADFISVVTLFRQVILKRKTILFRSRHYLGSDIISLSTVVV
jgi:hypothetical protein